MAILRTIPAILALLSGAVLAALPPIEVHQQEFIDSQTNDRFVIIGVDYQPGGSGAYGTGQGDPLSNATACLRDAALMQELGVNTIRCYNVDPTLNHDECVSIFDAVGIYMVIDVNSPLPNQALNQAEPWTSYDVGYLEHIFSVVEAFKSYPNTLGFFAGNEVINSETTGQIDPAYIRAVQRDLKAYIAAHASRTIPVGYSAADTANVFDQWAYLQCNNSANGDPNGRSDFFGLNDYEWCGNTSSYTISGYNVLVETFGNTTIPVFGKLLTARVNLGNMLTFATFSEYGCNVPEPRYFDEVLSLYGPEMTVLSGGLVYEYTEGTDNYGLVTIYSNGTAQLLPDYNTLMSQYSKVNVSLLDSSNSTATSLQAPACNANLISTANGFSTNFTIPDPPPGAEALISSGVTNAPTGSIVSVTQTSVQVAVYATNGAQITGLAIKMESDANHPGEGSGLASGAAPSATASGKSSASGTGTAASTAGGASASASASAKSGALRRADVSLVGSGMIAAGVGMLAFAL